jgi:exosortase
MNLYRRFLIFASLLTLCFALPLAHWARFALNSGLFSYVLLVPFISGYLIWIRRTQVVIEGGHARLLAVMLAAAGLGFLAAGMVGSAENVLTYQVLSYCCFLWSGGLALFGLRIMRWLAFPALFLVFIAPIPPGIVTALETALQHASADCAYRFIRASNIPVYRSDMSFYMPNFSMRVAHECSGIRSSLILFISALVAGHMFLRTSWTRWHTGPCASMRKSRSLVHTFTHTHTRRPVLFYPFSCSIRDCSFPAASGGKVVSQVKTPRISRTVQKTMPDSRKLYK